MAATGSKAALEIAPENPPAGEVWSSAKHPLCLGDGQRHNGRLSIIP